jgi:hypothetical protein
MGNVTTGLALFGYYFGFLGAGVLTAVIAHKVVKHANENRVKLNADNKEDRNYKEKTPIGPLGWIIPAVLAWLIPSIAIFFTKQKVYSDRNSLIELIYKNQDHFFAVKKDTTTAITVPESVARDAVKEITDDKIADTLKQVKDDTQGGTEFVALLKELNTAYKEGVVLKKGDTIPSASLMGYY